MLLTSVFVKLGAALIIFIVFYLFSIRLQFFEKGFVLGKYLKKDFLLFALLSLPLVLSLAAFWALFSYFDVSVFWEEWTEHLGYGAGLGVLILSLILLVYGILKMEHFCLKALELNFPELTKRDVAMFLVLSLVSLLVFTSLWELSSPIYPPYSCFEKKCGDNNKCSPELCSAENCERYHCKRERHPNCIRYNGLDIY